MIAEFLISTIIVGIIGSILIYNCKSSKKKMEEDLEIKVKNLEKIYIEERVKNNENLEKLKKKFEEMKDEYTSKKRKSKSSNL